MMHRECCGYCMWYGPVNQDGTMRKHKPRNGDLYGRNVQDATATEPCKGSHEPYATFGGTTVPDVARGPEPCGRKLLALKGSYSACTKPKGHTKACAS